MYGRLFVYQGATDGYASCVTHTPDVQDYNTTIRFLHLVVPFLLPIFVWFCSSSSELLDNDRCHELIKLSVNMFENNSRDINN